MKVLFRRGMHGHIHVYEDDGNSDLYENDGRWIGEICYEDALLIAKAMGWTIIFDSCKEDMDRKILLDEQRPLIADAIDRTRTMHETNPRD